MLILSAQFKCWKNVYALKVTKQNYDSACYKCEPIDAVLKSAETAVTKQIAKLDLDVYVQ